MGLPKSCCLTTARKHLHTLAPLPLAMGFTHKMSILCPTLLPMQGASGSSFISWDWPLPPGHLSYMSQRFCQRHRPRRLDIDCKSFVRTYWRQPAEDQPLGSITKLNGLVTVMVSSMPDTVHQAARVVLMVLGTKCMDGLTRII